MQFIKYSIASFASVFIVALTSQASVALTIIPNQPGATKYWRPISYGELDNNLYGVTQVDTRLWTNPLPLGGSNKFKNELLLWSALSEFGFFAWNFKPAQRKLTGSFEIQKYLACNVDDYCGDEERAFDPFNPPKSDGVGASFRLGYTPGFTDPQPGQKRIHWIQMARASFAARRPGYVSNRWFIDNDLRRDNPYYDTVGEAGEDYFVDVPYNPGLAEARKNHYFETELYLVEDISPQVSLRREVRIYDGIRWGWRSTTIRDNQCLVSSSTSSACPPPPPPPPPPDPCNGGGGSGGGGCYRTAAVNQYQYQELSDFDIDDADSIKDQKLPPSDKNNQSKSPVSVPESTSALGLLALGAWGIVKALKIKKDK